MNARLRSASVFNNAVRNLRVSLFVVKAVFVWLVIGTIVRRKYRRCIERNEIFYLDDELGK